MEIRYAEVLLNLAEMCCGYRQGGCSDQEAYTGLVAVRKKERAFRQAEDNCMV